MKKINRILMITLTMFLIGGCGGQEEPTHIKEEDSKTDSQLTDDDSYVFNYEYLQAEYYDSAETQAASWDITAFSTTFSFDDEGYRIPTKSKYDGFDFWMDTYYGSTYPFETGVVVLGDSAKERDYMTCTKCLVFATGMTANSTGKQHLAIAGTINIEEFADGKLRAVAENLVLQEFEEQYTMGDKGFEVLSAAPLVENGEVLKIKKLVFSSDSVEEVYVRNCDDIHEATDAVACAGALNMAVVVK